MDNLCFMISNSLQRWGKYCMLTLKRKPGQFCCVHIAILKIGEILKKSIQTKNPAMMVWVDCFPRPTLGLRLPSTLTILNDPSFILCFSSGICKQKIIFGCKFIFLAWWFYHLAISRGLLLERRCWTIMVKVEVNVIGTEPFNQNPDYMAIMLNNLSDLIVRIHPVFLIFLNLDIALRLWAIA